MSVCNTGSSIPRFHTAATGVDRVRQDGTMTQRNGGVPVNGRGVSILVNDSGVDATHPDLGNVVENVTGYLNLNDVSGLLPVTYVEGVPNTDIGGGHGTHVASIAGGTGAASGGALEGVAPGAGVAGFGSGLAIAILNVVGGFDYALRNQERLGIRVINNSWGDTSDTGDFNPDDPVNVASKALNDAGVVVVFSAGNAGPNPGTETFAFTHPDVDIVTTSYGPIGSIPLPNHLTSSYTGVVRNGKLHFGAADNSPSTAMQDSTAGPWWSIGIAGFEEASSEGRQVLSGSFPDFVGDFYQEMPYCHDCESGLEGHAGTSFATPRSAGTMSKLLLEVRRALSHAGGIREVGGTPVMAQGPARTVTNWELRRALEEAAYYPSVFDYSPVDGALEQSVPVLDPTPWTQVGWGVITPEPEHRVIDEALAHLGLRGAPARFKDYGACQFQTGIIQVRHAYWDTLIVDSESWLQGYDPYIYCGP